MSSDTYQTYAVRYAHHQRRTSENFLGGNPRDGLMPLDYFLWAIVGESRTLILDTGFGAPMEKRRAREFLRPPRDGLVAIGVDPAQVGDVIISHMRYDHAGMCHPQLRRSFEEAGTRRHRRQAQHRAARVDQPARTPAAAASRTSSSRPRSMSSSEPNAFM